MRLLRMPSHHCPHCPLRCSLDFTKMDGERAGTERLHTARRATSTESHVAAGSACSHIPVQSHDVRSPRSETLSSGMITPVRPQKATCLIPTHHQHLFTIKIHKRGIYE